MTYKIPLYDVFHQDSGKKKLKTIPQLKIFIVAALKIIDSSKISLGANLCDWAFVDKKWTGIKIHTKVVVADPDTVFAEQIVPSTGNMDDRYGSAVLVMEVDATYVLVMGYIDYGRMDDWDKRHIYFVMRLQKTNKANVIEEFPVLQGSNAFHDAKICLVVHFDN